jgi:outer membrane lipoprotein-sorting protein
MKQAIKTAFLLFGLLCISIVQLKGQNATAIIRKMNENALGNSNTGTMKMTIIRPDWTREMVMKSWSKGQDYALILLLSPARDEGTGFLKRDREIWNWQPSIDRVIKLPPSMMMQSWMGSDFTNDDLVQQSSVVDDYTHEIKGEETINSHQCYIIELTPKPEAPVVWGKIKLWVEKNHYFEVRAEFYDEDDYLVNIMRGKEIKNIQGRYIPTKLIVSSEENKDEKTIIEYEDLEFDISLTDKFFTLQNMKRLRSNDY